MKSSIAYLVWNEISFKLKTSLLFWCYTGCILMVWLPSFLGIIIFQYNLDFQSVLFPLLSIFVVFFLISLDIFSREAQLHMLDFFGMNSARFKTIYFTRIIANAVLMTLPIISGFLLLTLLELLIALSPTILVSGIIDLIYIPLFFSMWFLILVSILAIIELKIPDSLFRIILYLGGIITVVTCLFILDIIFPPQIPIIDIFIGIRYHNYLPSSLMAFLLIIGSMIILLNIVLTHKIDLVTKNIGLNVITKQNDRLNVKTGIYSLSETFKDMKNDFWRQRLPYVGVMPYFVLSLAIPDVTHLIQVYSGLFGVHFFILLLNVLLMIFPQITLEKEFNMEEMLLSRITVYQYFLTKTSLLLRNVFYPFIVTGIVIIILVRFHSLNSFILLFTVLLIRAFYFVALIIFIWRLFPSKNLLHSTLMALFGLEILGFFVAQFLFPPAYFVFSPILSTLVIPSVLSDPLAAPYLPTSIWMDVMISMTLYLGSLVLIKSEIRFD